MAAVVAGILVLSGCTQGSSGEALKGLVPGHRSDAERVEKMSEEDVRSKSEDATKETVRVKFGVPVEVKDDVYFTISKEVEKNASAENLKYYSADARSEVKISINIKNLSDSDYWGAMDPQPSLGGQSEKVLAGDVKRPWPIPGVSTSENTSSSDQGGLPAKTQAANVTYTGGDGKGRLSVFLSDTQYNDGYGNFGRLVAVFSDEA